MSQHPRTVPNILNRLSELQTQHEEILQEQQSLLQQLTDLSLTTQHTHTPEVQRSANIQTPCKETTPIRQGSKLHPGEHVYIKNKISHAFNGDLTPLHRAGIVTDVQAHKIYLRTYSGVETWRSPNNLRRLTSKEKDQWELEQRSNSVKQEQHE